MPEGFDMIFDSFKELRFSSHNNALTPREKLTFAEIFSYKNLMLIDMSPTEINLIMSLDAIFNGAIDDV